MNSAREVYELAKDKLIKINYKDFKITALDEVFPLYESFLEDHPLPWTEKTNEELNKKNSVLCQICEGSGLEKMFPIIIKAQPFFGSHRNASIR